MKAVVEKSELKSDRKWDVAKMKSGREWDVEDSGVRKGEERFMPVST